MTAGRLPRHGLVLGALVLLALAVRLWGITFGLPHVRVRPDELYLLNTVVNMHGGQPNPGFFDWGALYMYLVAGLYTVYYGLGLLSGRFEDPQSFVSHFKVNWEPYFLIGRVTNAVLGAATVGLVHAVASRLADRTTALLAALFMALAFLHVRDSHYATTDVTMTFFLLAAVLAAVKVYRTRSGRDAWLAGALAGCAASAKYYGVFVVLVLAVVEVFHAWDVRRDWRRVFRETCIFRMAAACVFVFAVTNPYLFLDWQRARPNIEALLVSTAGGMTPCDWLGQGWSYHLPNSLRYGLGFPLLAASLAGMLRMAVRAPREAVILASFPIAYYAANGPSCNVFVRYMIPVVPFLCIFAGYAVAELARLVRQRAPRFAGAPVASLLGILIVAPSAWSVIQFDRLAAREDSRVVTAQWIRENVPAGSVILMSGNLYGHPQLERGPVAKYRYIEYNRHAQVFLSNGQPTQARPDWIIVQRHPIPYANPGPVVTELVNSEYVQVHTIRAFDPSEDNFYDIQDGFYAPFGGFTGVRRFGPNFEIYRRKEVGGRR